MGDKIIYKIMAVMVVISCILFFMNDGGSQIPRPKVKYDPKAEIRTIRLSNRMFQSSVFEPSGVLWVEELSRYLIVSDDTGRGKLKNEAFLFLMDENGRIDDFRLEIKGVDKIRDLESITRDDKGNIYLVSSQVTGRSGKRNEDRELILKTRLVGRSLVKDSEVHFLSALKDAVDRDPGMMESLGIDDIGELNIEGASFYRGKLYLGLDSPLDDQGRALIWRVEKPSDLFSKKLLDRSSLRLWARVHLPSFGKKQKDGIGELLFRRSGELIILSGREEGGKVWQVASPGEGVLEPGLLRSFRNLNPEGVALSDKDGFMTLVFDQGKEQAMWLETEIAKRLY